MDEKKRGTSPSYVFDFLMYSIICFFFSPFSLQALYCVLPVKEGKKKHLEFDV